MDSKKRLQNDIVNIVYRYLHRSLTQKVITEHNRLFVFDCSRNCIIYIRKVCYHYICYRCMTYAKAYTEIRNYRTGQDVAPLPKRYFY
jgi:hypothetical protein